MRVESVTCVSFPYNTERLYKLKRHLAHNGGVSNYLTLQREGFDLKHLGIYGLNPAAEVSINSVEEYLRQLPKLSYGVEHRPGVVYFTFTPGFQEKLRDSHVEEIMKKVVEVAEENPDSESMPSDISDVMGCVRYEVKDGEIVIHSMSPYFTHENVMAAVGHSKDLPSSESVLGAAQYLYEQVNECRCPTQTLHEAFLETLRRAGCKEMPVVKYRPAEPTEDEGELKEPEKDPLWSTILTKAKKWFTGV